MVQLFEVLLTSTLLQSVVFAKPFVHDLNYKLKDAHHPSAQWRRITDAPKNSLLNLRIGLKTHRWDELERRLYEVSDPAHPEYGNHLSAEEVQELSKPHPVALDLVHKWLASQGLSDDKLEHNAAKDWIKLTVSVDVAEKLLRTKYSVFQHDDGTEVIRTPQWSLPQDLHQHVVAIQPTNSFLRETPRRVTHKPMRMMQQAGANFGTADRAKMFIQDMERANSLTQATLPKDVCNTDEDLKEFPDILKDDAFQVISPTCIRVLYKTWTYQPKSVGKQTIGFANYLNETSMDKDLTAELEKYRPNEGANYTIPVTIVNNGSNTQLPTLQQLRAELNAEGNLDGQMMGSIALPIKVHAWNTGGSPPFIADEVTPTNTNEPYLEWLEYMLTKEKELPSVVGTSYGDDEQTVPKDYAIKVCQEMAKLTARGVSLLFASGDNGVGKSKSCITNDGKNARTFLPSFPASCPYVTVVGGTKLQSPENQGDPYEVVAYRGGGKPENDYASGGGFSNYFEQPEYQKSIVAKYVQTLNGTNQGLYNASGRAYPDMAALGQGIRISHGGNGTLLDGTSASTPIAAAIIGLLNDVRLSAGKPVLGFLNPWLYSEGYKVFNDITSGSAKGCEVEGFKAGPGWDAVTGFGTPDFIKLKAMMDSYQPQAPPLQLI